MIYHWEIYIIFTFFFTYAILLIYLNQRFILIFNSQTYCSFYLFKLINVFFFTMAKNMIQVI